MRGWGFGISARRDASDSIRHRVAPNVVKHQNPGQDKTTGCEELALDWRDPPAGAFGRQVADEAGAQPDGEGEQPSFTASPPSDTMLSLTVYALCADGAQTFQRVPGSTIRLSLRFRPDGKKALFDGPALWPWSAGSAAGDTCQAGLRKMRKMIDGRSASKCDS